MTSRVYVRDLEVLQGMAAELEQFQGGARGVLDKVNGGIVDAQRHVEGRLTHWSAELRRREAVLHSCQSDRDKNRSCGAELAAVRDAQAKIELLHRLTARLEQAIGGYQPHANRMRKVLDRGISEARGALQGSIDKYRSYLERSPTRHAASVGARSQFDRTMTRLTAEQKGGWGELAVVTEATDLGHVVLGEHWDNSTARGFDCMSMDPRANHVHIWEAKNLSHGSVRWSDLSAWQDKARTRFRNNWQSLITSVPEGTVRDQIRDAVNQGRVTYHLRLGPSTGIAPGLEAVLNEAVAGADYDWKQYSAEFFRRIGLASDE